MTTLVLGGAPVRDLGHLAILRHAQRSLPDAGRMLMMTPDPKAPPEAVVAGFAGLATRVGQVLLTGSFLRRHALEQSLAVAGAAVAAGARFVVHNLALEGDAAAEARPAGAEVLRHAALIEVRDHRTATQMTCWDIGRQPRILAYPERHEAADDALCATLPEGPILGVAIRNGDDMEAAWRPNLAAVTAALGEAAGWPALPLHICPPGNGEDDLAGTRAFLDALRPGAALLLPELADPKTWQARITPARLKALAGRCALVVTNRDLPAAYATACGVPVLGLSIGGDRRLLTCMATLARELPQGSRMLVLQATAG